MNSAIDVARFFIAMTDADAGEGMTNLKVQKLLYYAQGVHLALTGTPVFREEIEAWQHGPVVPEVYHEFKQYGSSAIPPDCCGGFPDIDENSAEILAEVFDVFGQFSAWKLRNMTHDEPPWKNTIEGCVISHKELSEYFRTQVKAE